MALGSPTAPADRWPVSWSCDLCFIIELGKVRIPLWAMLNTVIGAKEREIGDNYGNPFVGFRLKFAGLGEVLRMTVIMRLVVNSENVFSIGK
jgi:hypothetical protein